MPRIRVTLIGPVSSSAGVPVVSLSAGPVEYAHTGGSGPVLVLTHGLLKDVAVWAEVIAALSPGHRWIASTSPVGAHRRPMTAGAEWQATTAERLRHFRGRSRVCWTDDDLVMPAAHGPRLRDPLRAELAVVPGHAP